MIEQKTIKLSKVSMNKDNPRVFTKANINDIIRSLLTFPEMLHGIRAIAIKDNVVLGGNLRLKGLKSILDLSIDEIAKIIADNSKDKSENRISYLVDYWTEFKTNKEMNFIIADNLTDQQAKEFLIKDNVNLATFDFDMLANNWDSEELNDWGVSVWIPEEEEEIETKDSFTLPEGDREPFQQMSFTFADEQAEQIKNALADIKKTDDYKYCETFGNENSNGNSLYLIVKQWAEQKKY